MAIAPSQLVSAAAAPAGNPAQRESPSPGMAQTASRGMVWMMLQTVVLKAAGSLSQIVLAYFLVPEEWGLVGLASTVMFIAGLIQQGGLRQVLVSRQKSFRLWSGQAVWLSMALGIASALFVAAVSPFTAQFYQQPKLIPIMGILAVGLMLDSLLVVPIATMQASLRFKQLAALNTVTNLCQLTFQVILAALDFGAYSIVVPKLFVILVAAVFVWRISGTPMPGRVRVSRWRFLLCGSVYVLVGLFFFNLSTQAVVASVGKSFDAATAGLYVFAYNLSFQTVTLITLQMEGVLFASLSKMQDQPERQLQGFVRATRLLAMLAMPLCMAQAAVADPLIKLIFKPAYHPAIVLVQILSVAMAFHAALIPTGSFMQAQGRFRAYSFLGAGYALAIGVFLTIGILVHDLVTMAALVACGSIFAGTCTFIVSSRGVPGSNPPSVFKAATLLVPTALIAAISFGVPAFFVQRSGLPETVPYLILRTAIIGIAGSVTCLLAFYTLLRRDLLDIAFLARTMLKRGKGSVAAPSLGNDLTPTLP